MSRKQLYADIVGLGLQNEVKSRYGRNYTQVPNDKLEKLVREVKAGLEKKPAKPCKCATPKKETKHTTKCDNKLEKLISLLHKKHLLLDSEVKSLNV